MRISDWSSDVCSSDLTTLNRDIERARIEDARLAQLPVSPEVKALRADVRTQLDNLAFQQSDTIVQLSAFPQYRVVASGKLDLAELQQVLRPGEAYLKMLVVGEGVYAMLIEPDAAQLWKYDIRSEERRVGKECGCTGSYRWPTNLKKKKTNN